MDVHYSSESHEWETPAALVQQLQTLFGGFTLDPCCTAENAKAPEFFTAAEDGLKQSWTGHHVFMNPPYGRQIGKWIRKAYEESREWRCKVTCLIPSRTDTRYWHDYVLKASNILFVKNRIYFGDGAGRAPFPSAVVFFNQATHNTWSPLVGSLVLKPL